MFESASRCFELGLRHESGDGVPRDAAKAAKWFAKAAAKGSARGQHALGRCYQAGSGVPRDEREAVRLFHVAARELPEAKLSLAQCLASGIGTEMDQYAAFRLFREAADSGNVDAAANVGMCYRFGAGVDIDTEIAGYWLRRAAGAGSALAMGQLRAVEAELLQEAEARSQAAAATERRLKDAEETIWTLQRRMSAMSFAASFAAGNRSRPVRWNSDRGSLAFLTGKFLRYRGRRNLP